MSKYDGATIEVLNWDKFNPRSDAKRPSWFRMENNVATGPGFFGLDGEQKWLWVFILSLVSQRGGQPITWNTAYAQPLTGIAPDKQDLTIEIFEKFGRLRVSRKVTSRKKKVSERASPATYVRTNDTNDTNDTIRTVPGTPESGAGAARPARKTVPDGKTVKTWEAYRDAYESRYGEPPVRNAAVNGQLANLIGRIGQEEAPAVAAFYIKHNSAHYVRQMHPVRLLVFDAEKLRTEWATGNRMLGTTANEIERIQNNKNVFQEAAERLGMIDRKNSD